MSTQTVNSAGLAAMPRVNLMPPEIAEAARFRQIQALMGGAVVVSAAVVALLYAHAKHDVNAAQAQVDAANAQGASLQTKVSSLASVAQTYAGIQSKQALLEQAMGQEIRWSYILNDLSYRVPANVWLTSMTATETTAPGTATTAPTQVLPGPTIAAIGTIQFSGSALKHDDVAAWLDSQAKEKGFSQPTFSDSKETLIGPTGVVDFDSSVLIDSSALSNRYVPKAGS